MAISPKQAGKGKTSAHDAGTSSEMAGKTAGFSNNISTVNREFQEKSTLKQARDLGLPYINIGKTPLNPDFLKLISFEVAKKARIVPFFRVGKNLRIAAENPDNPDAQSAIQNLKNDGYEVSLSLASAAGIDDAMKIYEKTEKYKRIKIVEKVAEKDIATYEKEIADLAGLSEKLNTVTAEEGLNMVNVGAMKTGASDVHYEPGENVIVVRFRIDGVLHKVFEMKIETYKNIANQLKYIARMKLNTTTVPQDGRYHFVFNEKKVAVRVSSIPTPNGESFVCRYLVSEEKTLGLEELGFEGAALEKLQKACSLSHGMILCTGPTGSGKTTTLYSMLNLMKSPENKVITLEDPVEYQINGVTQSQIAEKQGYDFATGLKTVLRQDPDIVMLGEIRDLETAQTAAQAALTGHVVLSTLHTNSAIETVPRLMNMGLPAFMIAPALDTVIAQRLVRRICPGCGEEVELSDSQKKEFEEVGVAVPQKIQKVNSCDSCSRTGYKGRLVIAEVITVSVAIKELILNGASTSDLMKAVRQEGMITMREDGFAKVAQGLTTLEEVYRVTNVSS